MTPIAIQLTNASTPGSDASATPPIDVQRLLAYKSGSGHTELSLVGGETLRVRETTDQIDRLVRSAFESSPYWWKQDASKGTKGNR